MKTLMKVAGLAGFMTDKAYSSDDRGSMKSVDKNEKDGDSQMSNLKKIFGRKKMKKYVGKAKDKFEKAKKSNKGRKETGRARRILGGARKSLGKSRYGSRLGEKSV